MLQILTKDQAHCYLLSPRRPRPTNHDLKPTTFRYLYHEGRSLCRRNSLFLGVFETLRVLWHQHHGLMDIDLRVLKCGMLRWGGRITLFVTGFELWVKDHGGRRRQNCTLWDGIFTVTTPPPLPCPRRLVLTLNQGIPIKWFMSIV